MGGVPGGWIPAGMAICEDALLRAPVGVWRSASCTGTVVNM